MNLAVDPMTLVVLVLLIVGVVLLVRAIIRVRRRKASEERWTPAEDAPLNTLAVVALVLAFVATIPSIVCGHIALRQVELKREKGRGLALAALWISYTVTVLALIATPLVIFYATRGA